MKTTRLTLLVFLFFGTISIFAQNLELGKQDSIVKSSWIFGIGFNAVDDAGSEFTDFLNVSDNWNIVPFPSRLSIGRYFENGLGLEAIGSYNRYNKGKIVDGAVNTEDIDYFAIDLRASYDLNKIIGQTGFFDPYVGLGVGYTDANNQGRGTFNTSVGFRAWINDRIGLDFNSTGKWAMSTENATNHIQHGAGLVYQFGTEKGLSKRGEEKLAQIKEIEAEQQRIQDSISSAQLAEREAIELAAHLNKEKEEARLVAEKEEKINKEKARRLNIENEIKALGNVYFNLNSSYLKEKDKQLLEKLASILKENPSAVIKVSSHTDSRGGEKYNQWLSERRVKRTVDYLNALGVSNESLLVEAKGELDLTNHCIDGVKCTEKEHQENRRCEFEVISLD